MSFRFHTMKRWTTPWSRKYGAVYQQWHSADTLELQPPTNNNEKADVNTTTERPPHSVHARTAALFQGPWNALERWLGPRFAGWRFGVLNFAGWASIVFLINLIVTVWGLHANKERGVILEGDCERVKNYNAGLHVLINVFSTILLSGSNYCMQALSAPTRDDVDKAHALPGGKWVDIGVPGIRNVKYISRRRLILWGLLGFSSLPVHLFYNSAVFASITSNEYFVFPVSQSYLTNPAADYNMYHGEYDQDPAPKLEMMWNKANSGNLDRLTAAECINQYAQIINSNRGSTFLVTADANFPPAGADEPFNASRAYWYDQFMAVEAEDTDRAGDIYSWICSGSSRIPFCADKVDAIKSDPASWHVGGEYCLTSNTTLCNYLSFPVEYCLSEKVEQHCKLQFQPTIAIVITVLNLVKAGLMFYIAFAVLENPLLTMGDAVASFLSKHDPTTKGMSLSALEDFKTRQDTLRVPSQWHNNQYRWRDVTSIGRQTVVILLFLAALTVVISLLVWGIRSLPEEFNILSLGYGAADPRTAIVGMPNDLLINSVVANSPQLVLSLLYFSYNALFTAMLMGYEWTTYAFKRKGLRVSHHPVGAQRSTYFIQLPYRFGLPLMILSGTLHWLVSQSIFLLAIDYYDVFGRPGTSLTYVGTQTYKTLGFSPVAIISIIVLGGLMVIVLLAVGFIPYKKGMPPAGSCSLAISAACHSVGQDIDGDEVSMEKLQWGVVSVDEDGIGHCAFSAGEVEPLVEGEMYN
ncbi:hypothetical protein ACN47E_007321 [Coniothyrium glycines]